MIDSANTDKIDSAVGDVISDGLDIMNSLTPSARLMNPIAIF